MHQEGCIVVKFSEGLGIFDQHCGSPQIDEQEIYDGPTGKVIDIQGIQAHAGKDFFVPEGKEFSINIDQCPYLHIAIKAEPGTNTCLFLLVHEREHDWNQRFVVIGKTPQGDCRYHLMSNYFTIEDDNEWHEYVYDLQKIREEEDNNVYHQRLCPDAGSIREIQFYAWTGSGTHSFHFNCLLSSGIEKQYSEFLRAQFEIRYLQKKLSRMSEQPLPQKDLAAAQERILTRLSELRSSVEDYEKSKCFRPTWRTERRKRTLAERLLAEAVYAAGTFARSSPPAYFQRGRRFLVFKAEDECPEIVEGVVWNPSAFKEYLWDPPRFDDDGWTSGGSEFEAIGPGTASDYEEMGTQRVDDWSQATGVAFSACAMENYVGWFFRKSNGISTIGVLQYTLPPPPCDMTVYWKALPTVSLPNGVEVSADWGYVDIDFVSFGQNPAAGFPGFKRFEWTQGWHFTKTDHNPQEFGYDVNGSFRVPKGVRTRVYIGVAIQIMVLDGDVCIENCLNGSHPLTDQGIFEVLSHFFHSGGPKAMYRDRVASRGELVKYPGVQYRMVRE